MRRTIQAALAGGLLLALAQTGFAQFGGRIYGPGGGIGINVPPIGGFGGLNLNIGGGSVDVRVGPSGYGPYGPGFGGVRVRVADPDAVYGPPVVYGPPALYAPAYNPVLGPGYVQTPYLDCVGSDCLEETDGTTVSPVPEVTRPGKEPPPLPPAPQLQPRTPAATSPETTVPQRKAEGSGPDLSPLPALPPQSSSRVAPRFFPTNGPALLPPGTIRQNGFDAGPRPNRPSLPGNDPFGPPRDPAELPET